MESVNNLPGHEVISRILEELALMVAPGVKTIEIDKHAEELIDKYGVKSSNKGYCPSWSPTPYPASTCIGVNSTIAHGIPGEYELREGDIVSIDLAIVDSLGNCADAALTVPVGEVSRAKALLLHHAYRTMMIGVGLLKPGVNTETIAREMTTYAWTRGYRINRKFSGHAIGKEVHQKPNIYNTQEKEHTYALIQEGQVFCVEPMLTTGRDDIGVVDSSGWTHRTADGAPSAFFEVMAKVTAGEPEILTNHIKSPPTY